MTQRIWFTCKTNNKEREIFLTGNFNCPLDKEFIFLTRKQTHVLKIDGLKRQTSNILFKIVNPNKNNNYYKIDVFNCTYYCEWQFVVKINEFDKWILNYIYYNCCGTNGTPYKIELHSQQINHKNHNEICPQGDDVIALLLSLATHKKTFLSPLITSYTPREHAAKVRLKLAFSGLVP